MSSMDRINIALISLTALSAALASAPANAQTTAELNRQSAQNALPPPANPPAQSTQSPEDLRKARAWDNARAQLSARGPGQMSGVIDRWEQISSNRNLSFSDYASFLQRYPDFPLESRIQGYAEQALGRESVSPQSIVAFFDVMPPETNPAKAQYALALGVMGRPEAAQVARDAWRGGEMSPSAESYISGAYGSKFTTADHDARMDALLWQGDADGASRQLVMTSPANRNLYMARLAMLRRTDPNAAGISVPADATKDPGYVWNLSRYYYHTGQNYRSIGLLANRQRFDRLPVSAEDMVTEMLRVASGAGAAPASDIAGRVDDLFPAGADIRKESYRTRDDYTSLMWLGGTKALWELGDGRKAAPLFYRYGAAARTPQTRSKGFYWAGLASSRAGDRAGAKRYYEMAAEYPDRFYGMLALNALGRKTPNLADAPSVQPTPEQRRAFQSDPLALAVKEVARDAPWRVGIRFYNALADRATTEAEHVLVSDFARDIGRRDLAVILVDSAEEDGHKGFTSAGFPTIANPPGTDWTMVHAISRQESQFAENALSHAGARGLMQLMPGTAREQAGKMGMSYRPSDLIDSPSYNMSLGNGYFSRMMSYYGGSYPLAVAAYNAGPGNVNKWLRQNGDPRNGSIDWVTWVEKIPVYETKNYVQRVLENAVVYESLYPSRSRFRRSRDINEFLR